MRGGAAETIEQQFFENLIEYSGINPESRPEIPRPQHSKMGLKTIKSLISMLPWHLGKIFHVPKIFKVETVKTDIWILKITKMEEWFHSKWSNWNFQMRTLHLEIFRNIFTNGRKDSIRVSCWRYSACSVSRIFETQICYNYIIRTL